MQGSDTDPPKGHFLYYNKDTAIKRGKYETPQTYRVFDEPVVLSLGSYL